METRWNQTGCFRPSDQQKYIEEIISSRPAIREEEDHSLYFDDESRQYFVVIGREIDSPPNAFAYHSVITLKDFEKEHPAEYLRVKQLIRETSIIR